MSATAFVTHQTAGRLRLRIPAHRHDVAYFERLGDCLAGVAGVTKVTASPETAGVLIVHDGADSDELFRAAADLMVPSAEGYLPERAVETVSRALQRLGDVIGRAGRGTTDAPSVLFLILAGLALLQIRRGAVLAPASTLLWYAFEIVRRGSTNR